MELRVSDRSRSGSGLSGDWSVDQGSLSTLARSGLSASHMSVVCLQKRHGRLSAWSSESSLASSHTDMTTESSSSSKRTSEIPVLVNGVQKWVTGLTRRTTCDDVIYALLRHRKHAGMDVGAYKMWERWRDVERPLRGRTKIYKVWRAWGSESCNVQFYLRKLESPLDTCGQDVVSVSKSSHRHQHKRTRTKDTLVYHVHQRDQCSTEVIRPRRSRSKPAESQVIERGSRYHAVSHSMSPVRSRPRLPPPPVRSRDEGESWTYHRLVQIILEQERQLQEQAVRIQRTDSEIENYETRMHQLRMQANGRDYVQNAYLSGAVDSGPAIEDIPYNPTSSSSSQAAELQQYLNRLTSLQDRIQAEEDKIAELSMAVLEQEEGSFVLEPADVSFSHVCNNDSVNVDWDMGEEVELLRQEIQRCVTITSSQQHHLDINDQSLQDCDRELRDKRDHMEKLCRQLQKEHKLSKQEATAEDDHDSGLSSPNSVDSSPTSTEDMRFHQVVPYGDWSPIASGRLSTIPECPSRESTPRDKGKQQQWVRPNNSRQLYTKHQDSHTVPCTQPKWRECDKGAIIEDDNSDTGLSSMHSDDHPVTVLETLV